MKTEILRIQNLNMTRSSGHNLKNIYMNLYEGEVLGIVGIHNSGKSFLFDFLTGIKEAGSGRISFYEETQDAKAWTGSQKIYRIGRQSALVEYCSVLENIFVIRRQKQKHLWIPWSAMGKQAELCLEELGVDASPYDKVYELSRVKRHEVELVKAYAAGAKLILIDDVTVPYTAADYASLYHVINKLRGKGISFMISSCKLDNLQRLADRCLFIVNEHAVKVVENVRRGQIDEMQILPSDAAGLGVSVPAEVGKTGILDYCEELGWGIVNIETLLSDLCGMKVRAGSSRNMAVLGEHWYLGANAPDHMAGILAGNELKGGIIVNNNLITDSNGKSGDLGNIFTAGSKAVNDFGNGAVLKEISSFRNMLERYREGAEYFGKTASVQNMAVTDASEMLKAARAGDPLSSKILDASASALALALYNIKCTVCIEKAVIGGEEELGRYLMAEKIAGFYGKLVRRSCDELKIEPSILGRKAEVYGSARYILMSENGGRYFKDRRQGNLC